MTIPGSRNISVRVGVVQSYSTHPDLRLDGVPVLVGFQEMELQSWVSPGQLGVEFEADFISDLVNVEYFPQA